MHNTAWVNVCGFVSERFGSVGSCVYGQIYFQSANNCCIYYRYHSFITIYDLTVTRDTIILKPLH